MSSEWKEEKLKNLCLKIGSGATPRGGKESYKNSGIPFIRSQNVYNHYFSYDGLAFIDDLQARKLESVTVLEDDILLNITGDSVCRSTIVPRKLVPARVNQHVAIIRTNKSKLNSFFLKSYLVSRDMQAYMLSIAQTGGTRAALTKGMIEEFMIPLPNLKEQELIARVLKRLDEKIELNNSINKNLEEMAQALFKRWFVDFQFPNENGEPYKSSGGEFEESELGLIPKGWRYGRATDAFDIGSGGTPKTGVDNYWNGTIPFFTPKDTQNSYYTIGTKKKITEEGLSNCNSKLYPINTVFITARGTVGKVMLAGSPMAMNQSCYALIAKSGYTQSFVFLLIKVLVSVLKKNASGAVFDAITVSTFQNLKAILPPISLISHFSEIVESSFLIILNNTFENSKLESIRDSLLPKLMSGEIRVPIDEQEQVSNN